MTSPPFPLVIFDVDGTLVDDTVFVWETLHRHFGSDPVAIRAAMEDYLAGRISYADWFAHDIHTLKKGGATRATIDQALTGMRLMDGALETIAALTAAGARVAVISGSLDLVLTRFFGEQLPFSDVFINRIGFDAAGEIVSWTPTPYDMDHKAEGLLELSRRYDLPPERIAFVGDNFNDVSIARLAGRSVAFNAKSKRLMAVATVTLLERDLRLTLPFLLGE